MNKNKEMNFVSAIIYLGDLQRSGTGAFLRMINHVLSNNFFEYEIICVSESISDSALHEIHEFKEETKIRALTLIKMACGGIQGRAQGLEKGMTAGMDAAIGDYVFEFDSSYKDYDEQIIMDAYFKIAEGYDIVSVLAPKMKFSSKIFYSVYNRYSNTPHKLSTERFRVLSRRAINRVESYSKSIPYRKAIYAACGLSMASISYEPIKTSDSEYYDSARWETASDAIVLFTNIAYKISLFFSIIMALFMVAFGIYILIVYFGTNKPVEGWASITGVICLGFSGIFVLQAIIFKYLEMVVRLIFRKQQYLISSIEKL